MQDNPELESFRQQWIQEIGAKEVVKKLKEPTENEAKDGVSDINAESLSTTLITNNSSVSQQTSAGKKSELAIDHYLTAITFEQEGRLGDALKYYRAAFKLDSHIDYNYRKLLQVKAKSNTKDSLGIAEIDLHNQWRSSSKVPQDLTLLADAVSHPKEYTENNPDDLNDMNDMISQLGSLSLKCLPKRENRPVHIDRLPQELTLRILKILAIIDIQAVGRASALCKKFVLITMDPDLWRFANIYSHINIESTRSISIRHELAENQDNDEMLKERNTYLLQMNILKQQLPRYGLSWKKMYMQMPHIRYDGIYISTCCYIRPGSHDNGFFSPVHLVTYYRYLRFFHDGTCMKLLTPDEPKNVVKSIKWDSRTKGIQRGYYDIQYGEPTQNSGQKVRIVVRDPSRGRMNFYIELAMSDTARGRHNKLNWINYSSINNDKDNDKVDYSLATFKPFFFSKVRSYSVF
ncbi:hypothetical protein H4219_000813 [Mycoemilia scoparia]|uniref:F-box domain-containing protein n=1 Tax=Mycoemilia scoparia TaxID=417184 RepID=A0A9W8A1Y2_9FUNG|nr:hypothetical protein H4219_000813 [Mycoemilia scoparia]